MRITNQNSSQGSTYCDHYEDLVSHTIPSTITEDSEAELSDDVVTSYDSEVVPEATCLCVRHVHSCSAHSVSFYYLYCR